MDRRAVGSPRHETVEHVELAHKVTLADAADRRVAGHLPSIFCSECEQANARTTASRSSRSLAPGMAGPDYQNVVHAQAP